MSVIKVNTIQNANGTTGITFAANGQMTLANTPLQLTGGQIAFPATQIASADGNTLDDYEEGTWTPTFTGASSAPSSVTYGTQSGRYTKIGRVVYVEVYIRFTAYSGGSGTVNIGGLPFTAAGGAAYSGLYIQETTGFSITGTYYSMVLQVNAGATALSLLKQAPNSATTGVDIAQVGSSTTVYIIASGCYTTT